MSEQADLPRGVDVAIVGGRVAGSALAAALARAGLAVAVFDRETPQRPTLSTHILHSTEDLRREGIYDRLLAAGVPALGEVDVRIDDLRVRLVHENDPGMCPRREILDQFLQDQAAAAGASIFTDAPVVGLVGDGARPGAPGSTVCGVVVQSPTRGATEVRAGLVVGADGRNSSVARWVGAEQYLASRSQRSLVWRYYRGRSLPPTLCWHRVREHIVSVLPTGADEFLLIAQPPDHLQGDLTRGGPDALTRHAGRLSPAIGALVEGAEPMGRLHAIVRYPCFFRRPYGPGWALVGDAGHAKDATIGHGINDALRNARGLAEAISGNWPDRRQLRAGLRRWRAARDRMELANYWYGQDLGRATPLSLLEREVFQGIRRSAADVTKLDDVMADRLAADRLLTGGRLALAGLRRIRSGGGLGPVAEDLANLVTLDWHRRRAAGRRQPLAPGQRETGSS